MASASPGGRGSLMICLIICVSILTISCTTLVHADVLPTTISPNLSYYEGQIRLVGGLSPTEGRVEIYQSGEWGTVCDNFWDANDARVVCRQLGYSGDAVAWLDAHYGKGTGKIWLDAMHCNGDEANLTSCSTDRWGYYFCTHSDDAGVQCNVSLPTPTVIYSEGQVRLVGGSSDSEGRVEIYHDGEWGTVCDDLWDNTDARVVCRQLGYSGDAVPWSNAHYGEGTGQIWLDNVECVSFDTSLSSCLSNGWGYHNCHHSEDAGVQCGVSVTTNIPTTTVDYYEGHVRLVGGSSDSEGRVEIYHDGEWGTVCDDRFGDIDAAVVCRQLSYVGDAVAVPRAPYGEGTGRIWLDDVNCNGYELELSSCGSNGWGVNNCDHSEDTGVQCNVSTTTNIPTTVSYNEGHVRLVGGSSDSEGRVEIYHNGEWGTVCDDWWDDTDARVVCRQLGYYGNSVSVSNARYGEGTGQIWLDDVNCDGYEIGLSSCGSRGWGNHNCGHWEDAGVQCGIDVSITTTSPSPNVSITTTNVPTSPSPNEGHVRLVGRWSNTEGRVEIYHNGEWGTVCDDYWDTEDARVVCRQLGYSGDVISWSRAHYGQGTGRIWLDDVDCTGTETDLSSCRSNGWGMNNCHHSEDAGVQCDVSVTTVSYSEGQVRLVGGWSDSEGRVEIYHNGEWGTVCDTWWDNNDARVVCRQLGYSGDAIAWSNAHFGQGTGQVGLDYVNCYGSETGLTSCVSNGWGVNDCSHADDSGVQCNISVATTTTTNYYEGHIRLVGGWSDSEGRVEIYHNGEWGTVCDDSWDDTDASVVCRELGYYGNSLSVSNARYGQGTGQIWLDDVNCYGYESALSSCSSNGWGNHNCGHWRDAGVQCGVSVTTEVPTGHVRLVGGLSGSEGRVEIYHNGEWGTVCDDSWDKDDARVVCRQLGYGGGAVALPGAHYGQGTGQIWLNTVNCFGHETSLSSCASHGWGITDCTHLEDAGVQCNISSKYDGQIRLVGGSSDTEGRVEIYHNGEWGTVCDDSWDTDDASVVCRQLGYSGYAVAWSYAHYGQGRGQIWLDNVNCGGQETTLSSCRSRGWGVHDCGHTEDAGVRCNVKHGYSEKVIGTMSFVGVSSFVVLVFGVVAIILLVCGKRKPSNNHRTFTQHEFGYQGFSPSPTAAEVAFDPIPAFNHPVPNLQTEASAPQYTESASAFVETEAAKEPMLPEEQDRSNGEPPTYRAVDQPHEEPHAYVAIDQPHTGLLSAAEMPNIDPPCNVESHC